LTCDLELYLDNVKINQHAEYIGQRSCSWTVDGYCPDSHTRLTDCFAWATKAIGNR